jgi:hypothetical protein
MTAHDPVPSISRRALLVRSAYTATGTPVPRAAVLATEQECAFTGLETSPAAGW